MKIIFKLLIISCLFVACIAHAQLIRGAGRGGVTVSFPTIIILTAESNLLPISHQLRSDYSSFGPSETVTTPPGFPMLMSVPNGCFVSLGGNNPPFTDDPCYYQFNLNEPLELTGAFSRYFGLAVNFQQIWRIYDSENSVDVLFEFSSPYTSVQGSSSVSLPSSYREVYLDVPAPSTLNSGEYFVSTEVTFSAPAGFKFFQIDSEFGEQCVTVRPLVVECFLGIRTTSDSLMYNSIWRERLVVVNEPQSMLVFSCSLVFLLALTKRNKASFKNQ